VTLTRGFHEIMIGYIELGGDHVLTVSWQGPGIGKQVIPASAFTYRPEGGQTPVGVQATRHQGTAPLALVRDGEYIRVTIPAGRSSEAVSLEIYDLAGARIATVFRGIAAPGTYRLSVAGAMRGASRGRYLWRLRAGEESRTVGMVYLP
jgi:hypothetical protein